MFCTCMEEYVKQMKHMEEDGKNGKIWKGSTIQEGPSLLVRDLRPAEKNTYRNDMDAYDRVLRPAEKCME